MRQVTVAESLGLRDVPGAHHKSTAYRLVAGTVWKIDDEKRDHLVIQVDEKVAKAAKYTWTLRWIDGRSVAVFEVGGVELAQPVAEDPKARDRRLGSTRLRRQRRDAPGVAPPPEQVAVSAPPDEEAPTPPRARKALSIVL